MKVLIVEDDPLAQKLLEMVMKTYFNTLDVAGDGEEGLKKCMAAIESGQPYGVIFLDVMMPRMNGLQMLEALRQEESKRDAPPCKVLMMTALDDESTINQAQEAGCDAYLRKPANKKALAENLGKLGLIS
jgi:two-component system chemotaxis response regulator CheY